LAENIYEGMFILDSNRYARDAEKVSGQIPKMIEKAGGEMLVSRLWEERRLAYSIKGHRKGTYWLTYFRLDGKELAGVERKCRLSDSILRVLFVKVDPRIADTLIGHAQDDPAAAESDKAASKTDKAASKTDEAASKTDKAASKTDEAASKTDEAVPATKSDGTEADGDKTGDEKTAVAEEK
jgi:small subunit ribosomal protein S6